MKLPFTEAGRGRENLELRTRKSGAFPVVFGGASAGWEEPLLWRGSVQWGGRDGEGGCRSRVHFPERVQIQTGGGAALQPLADGVGEPA